MENTELKKNVRHYVRAFGLVVAIVLLFGWFYGGHPVLLFVSGWMFRSVLHKATWEKP